VVVAGIVVVGVVVDTEGVDRSVQFNHYVIVTSLQHTSAQFSPSVNYIPTAYRPNQSKVKQGKLQKG